MSEKTTYIQWLANKTGRTELVKDASVTPSQVNTAQDYDYDAQEEPYVPIGLNGLMATTERLLAVNKGLADTDVRDSQYFKKHFEPDRQIWERIRTDVGNSRKKLLRMVSARKNLSAMGPFYFDDYTEKHITGNPLVTPLEEINPSHLVENQYRITGMGPGGIQSEDSITQEMNSVQASQFGFIDGIAGPECFDYQSLVYTSTGWTKWDSVTPETLFACNMEGKLEFHKPQRLIKEHYSGPMLKAKSRALRICVTPNHELLTKGDSRTPGWKKIPASRMYGKGCVVPVAGPVYEGSNKSDTFTLPATSSVRVEAPEVEIDMGDWCSFMGWFLSEGSTYRDNNGNGTSCQVTITQSRLANPEKCEMIRQLLSRLPLGPWREDKVKNFTKSGKQLYTYCNQFGGCKEKFLPDFLYEVKPEYRRRFLVAFNLGDGHTIRNCGPTYFSSSKRMVEDIERLIFSLGRPVTWHKTMYSTRPSCRLRGAPIDEDVPPTPIYRIAETLTDTKQIRKSSWSTEDYDNLVYCAEVPGNQLFVKSSEVGSGYWSGNSSKAGVDVRMVWGARMGSNGRIYQIFKNRRTGKNEWKAPHELDGMNLKLPD